MKWLLVVLLVSACGAQPSASGGAGGSGGSGGSGGADAGPTPDAFNGPWGDFSGGPIIDTGAPQGAPGLFNVPGSTTGGPCLIEPEIGSLFPRNWLRPRFNMIPVGSQNLFEIRLHAANEASDLLIYTMNPIWTMPANVWAGVTAHLAGQNITITVRGATYANGSLSGPPATGSSGDIGIAPVSAPGAIVYWTTTGGSALRGFAVGEETVRNVLRPTQAQTACVGCHSSTPDGIFVGFSASPNAGNGDPAVMGIRTVDGNATTPTFITASAQTLMNRTNQELPTFSRMHWTTGDRIMLSMFPINNRFEILWTDLEAANTTQGTAWNVLARTGDSGAAAYASFDHSGQNVLYVSSPSGMVASGVTLNDGDLHMAPWNNRAGGASTAIAGASDPSFNEYYPTLSPDDHLIAFNRLMAGQRSYNNAAAELFVIPAAGGNAVRLAANDPPACAGRTSPGLTNSWPKWAPEAEQAGGKTFYWLTFSSRRNTAGNPQLYATAIVIDENGMTTYPSLYLWNQPAAENNHTPAWDIFQIP